MTASTATAGIFRVILICVGLMAANNVLAEECFPGTSMQRDGVHKQSVSSDVEAQSEVRISAKQHELFHNPALNQTDGLSDYGEDFQTAYRR